nr:hypothetical protein [Exiguobacterium sp. H66]
MSRDGGRYQFVLRTMSPPRPAAEVTLKDSGASSPMMSKGTLSWFMSGLRCVTYFSYVPMAPSKLPADFMAFVAQMMTPILVWIAFSTWFSSLASTGLRRFHAVVPEWLNATSMDMSPFAKSRRQ